MNYNVIDKSDKPIYTWFVVLSNFAISFLKT